MEFVVSRAVPKKEAARVTRAKLDNRSVLLLRAKSKRRRPNARHDAAHTHSPPKPNGAAAPSSTANRRTAAAAAHRRPRADYAHLAKLHELWSEYAAEQLRALASTDDAAALARVLQALDRHAAHLEVARARCESNVGISGLVLAETARTFVLRAPSDKQSTVLKAGSVFRLHLPVTGRQHFPSSVLLDGDLLIVREHTGSYKSGKTFPSRRGGVS